MSDIYKNKRWGGKRFDFYSGDGSHSRKLVKPYVQKVSEFLNGFEEPLVVCDLGCGDFNVGRQLVLFAKRYIGIDVVSDLIERNRNEFQKDYLEFHCLNIVHDELPDADCLLVRQVLQHLSNEDISLAIEKFKKYRHVIVTEHLPKRNFEANHDKPTGAGIRLSKKSGVVLTEAPFHLNPIGSEVLLDIPYRKGRIVTYHYTFS